MVGVDVDGDGDNVVNEFTVGDVTGMVIYTIGQPRPTTRVELGELGEGPVVSPAEIKDIEDGDKAEITMSAPLMKRYKKTLAAYTNQLRDFCARREIMLVTVPSSTEVDTMVLDHLRRRGVVK